MTREHHRAQLLEGPTPTQRQQESYGWAQSFVSHGPVGKPCPATQAHLIPVFPDELDLAMAAIQDALIQNRKSKGQL